ncbi:peroxiredoxin-2-like [Temnothorax curvispinosus]|uniref:thioredoxin-dependent peroxiredoxin n=1 Tax=Temnothorax curvispinosus TaxID=300111 RepID=A0A6J1RC78_9HYME|nr:peroxiredoxin-2-like [Temnothorax curvispinosus]
MNTCCAERSETPRPPPVQLIPAVSRPAPPWSAAAIIDLKMQELSSQHFAGKYLVLLFYPCDFSFVCPTELIQFSDRIAEFRVLGSEVVAISTDSKFSHFAWVTTPRKQGGLGEMKIPLLSDKSHQITRDYGVLNEKQGYAYRALFVIDRQQIIRHVTINDEDLPRSVDEVLRVVKACCFVDKNGNICPYGPLPTKNAFGEEPDYFSTN